MKSYPLILRQGRTLERPFRRRYAHGPKIGQVIDYPEHGITVGRLQVRDKHRSEGGQLLLDLSTANGGVVLGAYDDGTGKEWSGYLSCPAAILDDRVPWGHAVWELVLWTPDRSWVKTIFSGRSILLPATTEVED